MSMSNALESNALDWALGGVDPAWRASATGYMALVTGASVDEANPLANECTYTGYARIAITKVGAWSGSGGVDLNALAAAVWAYATRTLTSGAGGLTAPQAQQLQDIFRVHGLDASAPLEVTPTSRQAGDVSQTISTAGDAVTVQRI